MAVKNEKQYEALKDKGMSKERAAKIANSPGASKRGGKKSGSGGNSSQGGTTAQKKAAGRPMLSFPDYVRAIRAVGPEHCFLASDVGQPQRPIQSEAWKEYLTYMMKAGLTVPEIDMMAKRNPARLIGLE